MSGYRHALLIGTESYRDERFARLPSTRADLQQLESVLRDPRIGGYDVTVRRNLSADDLRATVRTFCRNRLADDLCLIYVTGHGVSGPNGELVFVATDTRFDAVVDTGVRAEVLHKALEDCYSGRRIAILDTCNSGSFAAGFRMAGRRARGGTQQPAPPSGISPLQPVGVYVITSCDATQSAYEGGGTEADPEPSVFTGAMIDILRSGSAGASADGMVSVDDLFEAVTQRLLGSDRPQTPVKSTIRVTGAIGIAARPLGGSSATIRELSRSTTSTTVGDAIPDLPTLIAYHADAVQAESGHVPLTPVRGHDQVVVSGREQALSGAVDSDGCFEVPAGAEALARSALERNGPVLWMGWPTVVLYRPRPVFAPLLIRRVDVVSGPEGIRLCADGAVMPNPDLFQELLDTDEALAVMSSYRPTWHRGEFERMSFDAARLLEDSLGLGAVEKLRPESLSDRIDVATAGEDARNAAVLFAVTSDVVTQALLKDLDFIRRRAADIPSTALAALYPGSENPVVPNAVLPVTPLPSNSAQERVLRSAMTRRLTVATGPPGTGKSQLVVDVVATAVAAGQTVLVASTNNQAVDEVHRRCRDIAPGMMIRTGNKDIRTTIEPAEVSELSMIRPVRPTTETRMAAHRVAQRRVVECESDRADQATVEQELLDLGRQQSKLEATWAPIADLDRHLGAGWGARASRLSRTWWFPRRRRARFVAPLLGTASIDPAKICADLTSLDTIRRRASDLHQILDGRPTDGQLCDDMADSMMLATRTSTDQLAGVVADRARGGSTALAELARTSASGNWDSWRRAAPHIAGWAVSSLSARRFPTKAGLFDLVVIDEASQCSIPSILPLLFRARRALVIGDPMQLPHISRLTSETEAALLARQKIAPAWITENRLSAVRNSAFAAAERAFGEPLLLDEHYRCHPDIAAVVNRLFYQGRLTVLTDTAKHVQVSGPAITWRHVSGHAERGRRGRSWCNDAEAAEVAQCVRQLLVELPDGTSIGVVTPYRPQVDAIVNHLGDATPKVRVGTAHAFQGGECDVIVLSLVADGRGSARRFDWADQQPELWNVAITRARAQLVVVADRDVWARRGRVGGALLAAAEETDSPRRTTNEHDDDLLDRLYEALLTIPDTVVELGVIVNGHMADAVLTGGGRTTPVLLDAGPDEDVEPGAHLGRMLRRQALLGKEAVRIPAGLLFDADTDRLRRLLGR